jgi:hypothetical protein
MNRAGLEHPALRAWRELRPDAEQPEGFEILTEEGRGTVAYRLVRGQKQGSSVIAKRSPANTARVERAVYEEILPNLPLPSPHYYGRVAEPEGRFCWLFLEDVGAEKYHPRLHGAAAGRWLGVMHTLTARRERPAHLPERGLGHYLGLLRSARDAIESNLRNPGLKAEDREVLGSVIAHCDELNLRWSELTAPCRCLPFTLTHGDFIEKNVRVRSTPDGVVVLPFDWERAGWRIPAEDLAGVDIAAYRSTVQDHWPGLGLGQLRQAALVGRVFRCLVFFDWVAPDLASGSVALPMNYVRPCESWLGRFIRSAAWRT